MSSVNSNVFFAVVCTFFGILSWSVISNAWRSWQSNRNKKLAWRAELDQIAKDAAYAKEAARTALDQELRDALKTLAESVSAYAAQIKFKNDCDERDRPINLEKWQHFRNDLASLSVAMSILSESIRAGIQEDARHGLEIGESIATLVESNKFLAEDIAKLRAAVTISNDDANKLMAGTLKACEAIAAATVSLQKEVAGFSSVVTAGAPDKGYPEDNVTAPAGEAEVRSISSFIEAIQRGIPAEVAEQLAKDAEERKTALSAVSYGPGDE